MELTFNGKIFVWHGGYNTRMVPKQARFRWNPKSKKWWTDDIKKAGTLIEFADDHAKKALVKTVAKVEKSIKASVAIDANIEIPCNDGLTYLPYQKAGIKFASTKRSTLIGDEMGLGKTIQAIGVINLDPACRKILVICPASLKINWQREMEKWLVADFSIGIATAKSFPNTDIVIVNYDIIKKFHNKIHRYSWDMLIVDECHYVKNPKTARAKEILGWVEKDDKSKCLPAIKADRRLFMTGTPIVNRPIELWPIAHSLDPVEFNSFWSYAKMFCDATKDNWGWDFSGASNLDQLQIKLRSSIMVRRLKKDVLKELPSKVRQIIELPQNGCVKAIRAEAKALKAMGLSVEEAVDALIKDSIHFTELAKVRHETALSKVPAVVAFLEDALESSDKVVCFAHHRDVIEQICNSFPGSLKITGDTPMQERQDNVDRFQNDPSCKLFVLNLQAGGVGLTLTAASHVVFAEEDWVPGNISQGEDRCHRIGQKDTVLVQHLVLDGSIDANMAKTIVAKQAVIDQALDAKGASYKSTAVVEPEKKKAAPRRKQLIDPGEKAEIHQRLQFLSSRCDGALEKDGQGFNGFDSTFGKSLARQNTLSDKQAVAAGKMLVKYAAQLLEM